MYLSSIDPTWGSAKGWTTEQNTSEKLISHTMSSNYLTRL